MRTYAVNKIIFLYALCISLYAQGMNPDKEDRLSDVGSESSESYLSCHSFDSNSSSSTHPHNTSFEIDPSDLQPIIINQLTREDRKIAQDFAKEVESDSIHLESSENYLENRVKIAKAALCSEYLVAFMEAGICHQDHSLIAILRISCSQCWLKKSPVNHCVTMPIVASLRRLQ